MIIVDNALKELERKGKFIRVGLIGAGSMGQVVGHQILTAVPGMKLVAVANRTLKKARDLYQAAKCPGVRTVETLAELNEALKKQVPAVTENAELLCDAEGIDVLIEVTGAVEFSAHIVMRGIRRKKHLVIMNAELDSTVGPVLKHHADKAGVLLTNSDGDQPGVIMNLYREVKAMGLRPALCGNIKGLQDHYRTPKTQENFAKKWNQGLYMVTSFADGTKISFEQSTVANATGMGVAVRGMWGPTVAPGTPLKEAIKQYPEKEILKNPDGFVDFIVGPDPLAGVFVLGVHDHPLHQHWLKLYKVGDGPLYCFYTPYHLCHFLTPATVARLMLFKDVAIAPKDRPYVDVVATAKKNLKAGETVDPIGGFMTYGQCENYTAVRGEGLLPMGLAEGCVLTKDVPKDQVLRYADVTLPKGRLCDQLRKEQDELFPVNAGEGKPIRA